MAQNKFQQQSLTRKFVYFGLILVLFTVSLFLRGRVALGADSPSINKQAENLRCARSIRANRN